MELFKLNKKVGFWGAVAGLLALIIYMFLFRENSSESSWKTELPL